MQIADPPPHFDGRPPILDRSYTRVRYFGTRPGGATNTSPVSLCEGNLEDVVDAEDTLDNSDAEMVEEQPIPGPSSPRRTPPTTKSAYGDGSAAPSSSDEECEYDYEDLPAHLVLFDVALPASQSRKLLQSSRNFSVVGLETSTPFLRVGNVTFMGQWEESVGTGIMLKNHKDPSLPFPYQLRPGPLAPPLPSLTHSHIHFTQAINLESVEAQTQGRVEQVRASLQSTAARQRRAAAEEAARSVRFERDFSQHPGDGDVEDEGAGDGDDGAPDESVDADAEVLATPLNFLAGQTDSTEQDDRYQDSDMETNIMGSMERANGRGRVRGSRGRGRGRALGRGAPNLSGSGRSWGKQSLGPIQQVQRAVERALLDDRPMTKKAQRYLAQIQAQRQRSERASQQVEASASEDATGV